MVDMLWQEFQTENAVSLLQICGREYNPEELLELLSGNLEKRYVQLKRQDVKVLKTEYISKLYWKDEIHEFRSADTFNGIIRGIDESGRLMVETDQGIRSYLHKEIKYL